MGNWNDIGSEIDNEQKGAKNPHVVVRHKYLSALSERTNRNTVAYYSAWLQKNAPQFEYLIGVNDEDKNGFMACFHKMDFSKGLDLILHSPGGDISATESIIHYFRSKFADDIRVFVPQLSMSGGTMIAFCGREIWMGSHSNLGPIDPQFGGQPASLVIREFERAKADITANPDLANLWSPIIGQMTPTYLTMCEQSVLWCRDIAADALSTGMLKSHADPKGRLKRLLNIFLTLIHIRPTDGISIVITVELLDSI